MTSPSEMATSGPFACPACQTLNPGLAETCCRCALPLNWVKRLKTFMAELTAMCDNAPIERSAAPELSPLSLPRSISLNSEPEITFGRGTDCTVPLPDERIAINQCVIARQPGTTDYWIADRGKESATFVNRERIGSRRLEAGDFVQIGSFAWTFSATDGFLVPAARIHGIGVALHQVRLRSRNQPLDLQIAAGEFVAIIGPSGSGKSTLLKAIAGISGKRKSGQILALDGGVSRDIDQDRAWFRSILGYVSQEAIVHERLTPRQALEYSARLRGTAADPLTVEQTLRNAELAKSSCWDRQLHELSGGEGKRARTASELIARPRLLLLDEPASGLDHEREAGLMKHLRSLSYQGCTVILVTHGRDHRDLYDRLIEVREGGVQIDGQPVNSGPHECTELDVPAAHMTVGELPKPRVDRLTYAAEKTAVQLPDKGIMDRISDGRAQFQVLLSRELELIRGDWFNRLFVPLIVVAGFFAAALSVAIPRGERHLLGFFSVLACIWMGSSLSLLAIAGEREVFNHERHLFLRIPWYLLAKFCSLGMLSVLQTLVFCLLVWLPWLVWCLHMQRWNDDAPLFSAEWVVVTLSIVGLSGVALGLAISALVQDRKTTANFLLPLVMILQIVFSVQVAGGEQNSSLAFAYEKGFQLHRCANTPTCQRRARRWYPESGIWLCDRCDYLFRKLQTTDGEEKNTAELLKRVCEKRASEPEKDVRPDSKLPNMASVLASYLTLSRYADIALRSFAYHETENNASRLVRPDDESEYWNRGYRTWFREAMGALVAGTVGLLALTAALLCWQTREHRGLWFRTTN